MRDAAQLDDTERFGDDERLANSGSEVAEVGDAENDDSERDSEVDDSDETDSLWDDDPFGYDSK
ncbi:hypothetical protein ACFFQF_06745 [Haladaptatus pallidirubidus]